LLFARRIKRKTEKLFSLNKKKAARRQL